MLTQLRKFTRGWIALAIILLIGIAFVVADNADVVPGGDQTKAVSGGGRPVPMTDFVRELERRVRVIQQNARAENKTVTRADLLEDGLHRQLAQNLAMESAFAGLAKDMGVGASDNLVLEAIRKDPTFVNQTTRAFDPNTYRRLLGESGYSEIDYQERIRGAVNQTQIVRALSAGMRPPAIVGRMLYILDTEKRTLDIAAITPQSVGAPPQPTDAELASFYESKKEDIKLPEYRTLKIAVVDPATFTTKITVPQDRLQQAYEYERNRRATPELRTFEQLSGADDQAEAEQAAARLVRGEDGRKIAADLGMQYLLISDQPQDEAPDPRIAAAVFALEPKQTTGAIRGISWSAARLVSVTPPRAPSFEELESELRALAARDEAQSLIKDAEDSFQEALDGGADFDTAAKTAEFTILDVPFVDQTGLGPNQQPVAAVAGQQSLLTAAFETGVNETSDWITGEDGVARMVRVQSVKPSAAPPLEEIRTELAAAWRAQRLADAMRKAADDLKAAVEGGESFAAAAQAQKASVLPPQTIDRSAARGGPSPALVQAAFGAQQGEVVTGFAAGQQPILFVAHVTRIDRQDPAAAPEEVEKRRAVMANELTEGLLLAVQEAQMQKAKVRINYPAIQTALGLDQSEEGAKQ